VPGGRLAALATTRLVLPLADSADYAVAGVRSADVPAHRPPGRALLGEEAWECQLALPTARPPAAGVAPGPRPLRVVELPADPEPVPSGPDPVGGGLPLVVGPGGDDGAPLTVDLLRTGGLLVVGPPGSGRSSALDAFSADLAARGVPVARLGVRPAPAGARCLRPDDAAGAAGWLAGLPPGQPAVLVADDVGAAAAWSVLTGAPHEPTRPVAVLAAGSAGDLAGHYAGPLATLRRSRTGLLLRPGPAEADVLGVRLPRTPVPARPGSGWLVQAGVPTRVQVARRRPG
jgi:S-DNA-T family DNA segregation ATPase FtsK/SpoIIIE